MPNEAITTALVRRLRTLTEVSEEDVNAIHALPLTVREYHAEQPVVRDGQQPSECCLIVDGFCIRSKTIASGRRQILSIHIPAEMPDLMSLYLHVMDHDLTTLTPCTLGFISHQALRQLSGTAHRVVVDVREEDTPFLKVSITLDVEEQK